MALVGDAELDEGNVWEAIADPVTAGVGDFMLVIDLNRQSLDRVIPDIQAQRLAGFFANAGWHVAEAKYGRRLQRAFDSEGGGALRGPHRRHVQRGLPGAVRPPGRRAALHLPGPAPTRRSSPWSTVSTTTSCSPR